MRVCQQLRADYAQDLHGMFAFSLAFGDSATNKKSRKLLADILKNKEDSLAKIQELSTILRVNTKDMKWSIDRIREILKSKADEYDMSMADIVDELMDFYKFDSL